jgi:hypothetical protein
MGHPIKFAHTNSIVNSYIKKTTCNPGTDHQKYLSRGAAERRERRVEIM